MKSGKMTAFLIAATFTFGTEVAAIDKSKGVYRIPCSNGTKVKVTNNHDKHKPKGRIDMHGTGGSKPYKIVAAADGTVRYIVDNQSKQVDSKSGDPCTNNYVWIEHKNGEWTKYSHMMKNSATQKAKLKVGKFVKSGTYLGDGGKVGCASGDHLHFEVGVPRKSGPISATGGFLRDNSNSKRNRTPKICGISGGIFASGTSYDARNGPGNIRKGSSEVARHGVPARDCQCLFD